MTRSHPRRRELLEQQSHRQSTLKKTRRMSMSRLFFMLLMMLLGLAVVNAPLKPLSLNYSQNPTKSSLYRRLFIYEVSDKKLTEKTDTGLTDMKTEVKEVLISALSLVHRINLTEIKCFFKIHHGLQNFQDTKNGIRIYNISRIYVSDPPDCLHTKVNVINQSEIEMKPSLFDSPQNLTELEELYWPGENNESPPTHLTTIGKLITDKAFYRKLTDKTYTLLKDEDSGGKAVVDIFAPSGYDEAFMETKCSFRRHLQLEGSFLQNNTRYFNISTCFVPDDDDCLNTKIEELVFANSGKMQAIYNSSQINNIKGHNQPWRKAVHKIEIKSIRRLIEEDDDFAYLMKTMYKTLMSKEGDEFKDIELYATNVEPKGEKRFTEKNTSFRKNITYTIEIQGCIDMYNISESYIPNNPKYLSTEINVVTGPENKKIPFIYNTNQNLKNLRDIVGLDKYNQIPLIVQKSTIGAQIEAEKTFDYLTKTTHILISWEDAEKRGIISNTAEHQENFKLCSASTESGRIWSVLIGVVIILAMMAV